ncbi:hypothetical protein HN51_027128 [Arachis hypogaea]
MRPARRQSKDSFILPLLPTSLDFHQRHQLPHDSDASFASNHLSSASGMACTRFEDYKECHSQQLVISAINSFLSLQNFSITFKFSGTTSSKDIIETLKFLLREIEYMCQSSKRIFPLS